jgi:hypothetical protein
MALVEVDPPRAIPDSFNCHWKKPHSSRLPFTAGTKLASQENSQGHVNGAAQCPSPYAPPLTVSLLAAAGCLSGVRHELFMINQLVSHLK